MLTTQLNPLLLWMGSATASALLLRVSVKPRIQKDKWSLYWKVPLSQASVSRRSCDVHGRRSIEISVVVQTSLHTAFVLYKDYLYHVRLFET